MQVRARAVLGWVVASAAAAALVVWVGRGETPPPSSRSPDDPGRGPSVRPDPAGAAGRSTLFGTVRRAGVPVRARVEARLGARLDLATTGGRGLPALLSHLLDAPVGAGGPDRVLETGPDGRFEVSGVAAGTWHLRAVLADGARGIVGVEVPVDGARVLADVEAAEGREVLRGRVVRADGGAYTGHVAVGRAPASPEGPGAVAVTGEPCVLDGEGRFVATGLEPGPHVVVVADTGRFRAVSRTIVVPTSEEVVLTVPALEVAIAGRVVSSPDERPIAGAEVLAGGRGLAGFEMAIGKSVTDADGAFRLMMAAGPDRGLIVAAKGFVPTTVPFEVATGDPVTVRLHAFGRVTGRVTSPDGVGVAGVSVSAVAAAGLGSTFGTATTDGQGRYDLEGVPIGDVVVTAEGGGWVVTERGDPRSGAHPHAVAVSPEEAAVVDLVVERGARLAGRVVAADGAGVPGAVATLRPTTSGAGGALGPRRAVTDADGRFVFDGLVPGAAYEVVAGAAGKGDWRGGPVVATRDDPPPEVEVRPRPERRLVVTVTDEDGRPLLGAVASIAPRRDAPNPSRGARRFAYTDHRGVATFAVPADDAFVARATHDDFHASQDVEVGAHDTAAAIRLRPGLFVEGVVLDLDGEPARSAKVSISGHGPDVPEWSRTTVVDERGRFRLGPLEPGRCRLEARAVRAKRVTLLARMESVAAGSRDLVLRLARPEGEAAPLVVRVVDGRGVSVPRAQVTVRRGERVVEVVQDGDFAVVDLGGLGGDAAGCVVEASRATDREGALLPWGPATVGPLRATDLEVEVRLPPERVVEGVVRTEGGRPVQGAVVLCTDVTVDRVHAGAFVGAGRGAWRTRTEGGGRFRIGALGEAAVRVWVLPPAEFPAPGPVEATPGAAPVVIVVAEGVAATVVVLDETGLPVAGALVVTTVRERPKPGERWRPPREGPRAETDEEGRARLIGLDPRLRYQLNVSSPSGAWSPFERAEWVPRDETFRLGRAPAAGEVPR